MKKIVKVEISKIQGCTVVPGLNLNIHNVPRTVTICQADVATVQEASPAQQ